MAVEYSRNPVRIEGDTAYLRLSATLECAIDLDDLPWVGQFVWYPHPTHHSRRTYYYARAQVWQESTQKTRYVLLHRMLLGEPKGKIVDHRDLDTLNNRRGNLRAVTNAINCQNKRAARTDSGTGVRGVSLMRYLDKRTGERIPKYYRAYAQCGEQQLSEIFPYTPDGLERAKARVLEMRAELFTHSDGR